jgi:dynein heavy chain
MSFCSKALVNYPQNGLERDTWFFEYPSQPISTVDQIVWTNGVFAAVQAIASGANKNALTEFLTFSKAQIESMVDLVRTNLKFTQRATLSSLIVLDVHARDVVQRMINQVWRCTAALLHCCVLSVFIGAIL